MRDRPHSRLDNGLRALERLYVCLDLESRPRRLADENPDFVGRVAPGLAVGADLDDLGAKQEVLAHGFDDLVWRVRLEILRVDNLLAHTHLGRGPELPAQPADDDPRVDYRGARNPPLLDRHSQCGVCLVACITHVADDGETGGQHLNAVRHGLD